MRSNTSASRCTGRRWASRERLTTPAQPPHSPDQGKSLFSKTEYKVRRLDMQDILYIEALKDYIAIHTAAEKILSLQSMTELESLLPPAMFIRIHRSYIVAIHKIESIERSRVIINKQHLPVGDTYRHGLKRIIGYE